MVRSESRAGQLALELESAGEIDHSRWEFLGYNAIQDRGFQVILAACTSGRPPIGSKTRAISFFRKVDFMSRTRRGARLGMLAWGLVLFSLAGASEAADQESWDAIFMAGARVGHLHTWVEPVKDKGRDLIRVRVETELNYKRLDDLVTIKLQYGTIETPEGQVLRLDTRTLASRQEMRTYGDVIDGKMTLIMEGGGQRQQVTIPWGPDVHGPYAAEQSLSRKPMRVGDSRDVKMYMPDLPPGRSGAGRQSEAALAPRRADDDS
jgi:hypothetical protein